MVFLDDLAGEQASILGIPAGVPLDGYRAVVGHSGTARLHPAPLVLVRARIALDVDAAMVNQAGERIGGERQVDLIGIGDVRMRKIGLVWRLASFVQHAHAAQP